MANQNADFLKVISSESKSEILESIATHYGITAQEAFSEVSAPDAEHLLDYMVEPHRSATLVLMQATGYSIN